MTDKQARELVEKYQEPRISASLGFLDLIIILSSIQLSLEIPRVKVIWQSSPLYAEYLDRLQKHILDGFRVLGVSPWEVKLIEETFT